MAFIIKHIKYIKISEVLSLVSIGYKSGRGATWGVQCASTTKSRTRSVPLTAATPMPLAAFELYSSHAQGIVHTVMTAYCSHTIPDQI